MMELRQTEIKLIESVNSIIEKEGFSKLGVNKIAREAGCDKVLIYRYFGGLEGLVTAWATKYDFYTQAYNSFVAKIEYVDNKMLRSITKDILMTQLDFTRNSVTIQQLLLWEMSGDTKFMAIRKLREENGYRLQVVLEEKLLSSQENMNMYITVLISSINYVVLSATQYPFFNGTDFSKEASWVEYKKVLCSYVDMLFDSIDL